MLQPILSFWSQHAPVLSVLLPAFTAAWLLLLGDHEGMSAQGGGHATARLRWRRRLALTSTALSLLMAAGLVWRAAGGELLVYELGEWPAPFGIVLVVDRLAALMVLLTTLIALPVLGYACAGWDTRGRHFHAIFQFQLMGLCGAFLTGDLFNLFVFFEVLLIASYVLLLHGQGRERLRMGVHYVVLNLAASGLFLIGLAMIYATTGSLNMADVAQKVASLQGEGLPLVQAAALILLVVFGLKAALVPVYFWLPGTYAAASAPVAALFAIMTKVGVYSIIRMHWVIVGVDAGDASFTAQPWLLPLALLTSVLGVLGALAAHTMGRLVAYLTVSSVGTILAGVGLFTPETLSASLYYTLHSTVVIAGLFLFIELVATQRGAAGDRLQPAAAVREPVLLGVMMLFGAASAAGLPPLPGFLGKLMLLGSSSGLPAQAWVWSVVLLVGFLTIIGLARAGVVVFWHVQPEENAHDAGRSPRMLGAAVSLMVVTVLMAVWASPIKRYTDAAAQQLVDKASYAEAILGRRGGVHVPTTLPYDGSRGPFVRPAAAAPPPAKVQETE
ncbi:MAG TPA: monovalent cation/H+ antiporter subunit D [Hydrogenophaga sp.]|uniref:monovalent cation/H+ antiporter subunit D n=1 Tax=Hydrogenophaga sp. TaxID=1904254 RepID=UPI002CE0CA18|nr:monovalent cation/H+ antiporter subunit D [Hydrogenophaga sp.]HMN91683.1 monovalent cation/H+ antiporter subunit D [Hydrogenophaga sp.]HMP11245.1 monovalent cation/H+ antiporter subunit D [Hydrogenophaga sp.]